MILVVAGVSAILRYVVKQPLQLLEAEGKYDIKANLDGGGFTGQSQHHELYPAKAGAAGLCHPHLCCHIDCGGIC